LDGCVWFISPVTTMRLSSIFREIRLAFTSRPRSIDLYVIRPVLRHSVLETGHIYSFPEPRVSILQPNARYS